ncbi:MAG: hypothetical protein ISS17_09955 [Bacteroidales bacterium]|nr:hypothetical protein [Bacteroidales bacterium]
MKTTLTTLGITLAVILITFTGCKKNLEVMEPAPSPAQTTAMADMKVNSDFDWKTIKDLQVEIKSNTKAVLYIKSKEGTVYHKAMLNNGETYHTSIAVPTYEKELEILLAGQTRTIPVTNDWISVSFQ